MNQTQNRTCGLILVIASALAGQARGEFVDQRWERPEPYVGGGSGHSICLNSPIGQEFTPGVDNITAVELAIDGDYLNMRPGEIQPITVRIREDVITGYTVAAATLAPIFDTEFIDAISNDPYFVWLYFDLGGECSIIEGSRYVIDVSVPELGALNWILHGWQDTYNIGIPGSRITEGTVWSGPYQGAFGFRTYAIPEPATLAMLVIGSLALAKRQNKKTPAA